MEERPANLAVVECCATCVHFRGAWCGKWDIAVLPQTKCDTGYKRRVDIPMWVIVAPKD
jgi:hypothetical protein